MMNKEQQCYRNNFKGDGSSSTRGEFHFDQRHLIEPDAKIPNGTSRQGIDVHIGDWSTQGVNGQDHLTAEMPN